MAAQAVNAIHYEMRRPTCKIGLGALSHLRDTGQHKSSCNALRTETEESATPASLAVQVWLLVTQSCSFVHSKAQASLSMAASASRLPLPHLRAAYELSFRPQLCQNTPKHHSCQTSSHKCRTRISAIGQAQLDHAFCE